MLIHGGCWVAGARTRTSLSQCYDVHRTSHDPCDSLMPVSESERPLQCDYGQEVFHPIPSSFSAVRGEEIEGPADLAKGWYNSVDERYIK